MLGSGQQVENQMIFVLSVHSLKSRLSLKQIFTTQVETTNHSTIN